MVNMKTLKMPEDYPVPDSVIKGRAKDFAMAYWLTKEIGVVAIPPTEFYTKDHRELAHDWLRFAVCKVLSLMTRLIEGFGYVGGSRSAIEKVETVYSKLDFDFETMDC
jgi:kynurenine aminotransferase